GVVSATTETSGSSALMAGVPKVQAMPRATNKPAHRSLVSFLIVHLAGSTSAENSRHVGFPSFQDDHFVVQERGELQHRLALLQRVRNLLFGNQELPPADAPARGKPHANAQRSDGNEFIDRATPHAGTGQVDEVEPQPILLPVEVTVDQPGPAGGQ